MVPVREPVLQPTPILELRPTQITVGMREVHERQRRWQQHDGKKKAEFLGRHMIPVIRGLRGQFFVIDHHHLSLALHNEGVESVLVVVVADLGALEEHEFWVFLDHHGWVHPYDSDGRRRPYEKIPRRITALKDDPFRSLAGELRRYGGFAKDTTPFSEFLWADFLRRRIARTAAKSDFNKALKLALKLAKGQEARYLPGWCGPQQNG
jgi:hypothetical protein